MGSHAYQQDFEDGPDEGCAAVVLVLMLGFAALAVLALLLRPLLAGAL